MGEKIVYKDTDPIWNDVSKKITGSKSASVTGLWQSIKTAPKDETPVDIWCGEEKRRFADYKRVDLGKGNIFYDPVNSGRCCIRTATHWMPKPSAP
jgi:hypothetical protein